MGLEAGEDSRTVGSLELVPNPQQPVVRDRLVPRALTQFAPFKQLNVVDEDLLVVFSALLRRPHLAGRRQQPVFQ